MLFSVPNIRPAAESRTPFVLFEPSGFVNEHTLEVITNEWTQVCQDMGRRETTHSFSGSACFIEPWYWYRHVTWPGCLNNVWFLYLRDNALDFKVQTAKHSNMSTAAMRPPSEQSRDRASKRLSSESNGNSEGGVGASTPVELTALEESFRRFAIHGDTRATGKEMHGKNWSKLCKDCNVIDGKSITLTDVDIVFTKVK